MPVTSLPAPFVARMLELLGDEAERFFASYDHSPTAGLRINSLKATEGELDLIRAWLSDPVPWCGSGYYLPDESRPGRHPYHAAGLYYLQEPSAMAVAEAMAIQPGQLVLDLAASPGGKATHIASLLGNTGILVANDVIGGRIKPLGENLERWGAANTILLNEEPGRIADSLGAIFDRILLDAPCSGEGMFRKSPVAIREWSPEHVAGSAARQSRILADAARLVRAGGLLLYSTCTFSPEENEIQISRFLDLHPDWALVDIPKRGGISAGRRDWAQAVHPLERTARLWPHLVRGEGHFLALLRRVAVDDDPVTAAKRVDRRGPIQSGGKPGQATLDAWRRFAADTLAAERLAIEVSDEDQLVERSGLLYLAPPGSPDLTGLRVVRPGLPLGAAKPGRFEPAHALALALKPVDVNRVVALSPDDAERYLAGEQLAIPGASGWTLVTIDGFSLGWGRRSDHQLKNHYPRGLRRPPG